MKIVDSLKSLPLACSDTGSVVALGLFDGVHLGHQKVLCCAVKEASVRGLLPAVFTFRKKEPKKDELWPEAKRGSRALLTEEQKEEIFSSLGLQLCFSPWFEDVADMEPEEFFLTILKKGMSAKVLCCGADFRFGKGAAGDTALLRRLCEEQGMELILVEKVSVGGAPVSSSMIRELVTQGGVEQAAAFLGRPLLLDGPVIKGNQLGRTIGAPTINQVFPPGFAIPRYGAYATQVRIDGRTYTGVSNVGVKPTVGSEIPLCETYILDFSGDLYGKVVRTAFLKFLRPEQKFPNLEALRAQIAEDSVVARQLLEKR